MKRERCIDFFEVLELPPDASYVEVKRAYMLLTEIYSTDSIVTMSVEEDFADEHKQEIIDEIRQAVINKAANSMRNGKVYTDWEVNIASGVKN